MRARVEGYLEERLFEEGAEVEKGQKLFTIEKGPYEASLAEAQAALASAQATSTWHNKSRSGKRSW